MPKPRILLTNDDGIRAEGIAALWRALKDSGDVRVVAPESAQSATGHGVTLHLPLLTGRVKLRGEAFEGTAVDGRPADCVKLALAELTPDVQYVVSGMNAGANVGVDVFYSGTIAAAVEGAFLGKRAIAVSLHVADEVETAWDWAASVAMRTVRRLLEADLPKPGEVVSINVPALKEGEEPAGVRVVPQCVMPWSDSYERREDPNGRPYYWNTARFSLLRSEGDVDVVALRERFMTVTPLQFDLTAHDRLSTLAAGIERRINPDRSMK